MKKVLSIILSMVILLSMSIPAFAASSSNNAIISPSECEDLAELSVKLTTIPYCQGFGFEYSSS